MTLAICIATGVFFGCINYEPSRGGSCCYDLWSYDFIFSSILKPGFIIAKLNTRQSASKLCTFLAFGKFASQGMYVGING
jgi:hypothetical protein